MDLLQQTYGSSSSDDDDGPAPPAAAAAIASHDSAAAAQHHERGLALVAADALEQRKQEIARHFAQHTSGRGGGVSQLLRQRMTREEQAFAFHGYTSKRQRRTIVGSTDAAKEDERASAPLPRLFPSDGFLADGESSATHAIASSSLLPTRVRRRFNRHAGAANDVRWSPVHVDLFASASMDSTVRVWSTKENAAPCRRTLAHHTKGVKSMQWATDGKRILSGGYDGCAVYVDPETTTVVQRFEHDSAATCVRFHPSDPHFVLVGTDRGRIYSHDLRQRSDAVVNTYQAAFGQVHDLLFLPGDEQRFVSSAGVKYRDASHQTLLVWDFRSSALLAERLDRDMQPFQCLRLHPHKPWFVAQCSADYATLFSSAAPYKKLQKGKARFEGSHEVQGFSIGCSFNCDGSIFATGDANGRLAYYETTMRAAVRSLQAYAAPRTACLCAEFHPLQPSTLVTGGSNGEILLYGPPTRATAIHSHTFE